MSTAVAPHAAASAARRLPSATILARRGVLIAAAIAWVLVAIGAGLLLATSDHLVDPIAYGIQRAVIIVGWSSAALYWLVRRPGNRLGLAFVALALASVVMSLQGASDPLLHSIGVFGDFPSFLLAFYVVFAFPDGRLAGSLERLLLAGWVLWFLPFFPYASLLARRERRRADRRLQRGVSHERLHDRRPSDDRRRCSAATFSYVVIAVGSGDSRCLVLPPGDGNSTAQARAHSRLRTRRDAHGARPDLPRHRHPSSRSGSQHDLGCRLVPHGWSRPASLRISAFDRGEHVLRRDGVEKDRLAPGREPERLCSCARRWPMHSMIRRSSSGSVSSRPAALSTRAASLFRPRLRPASRRLRSRGTARPWP